MTRQLGDVNVLFALIWPRHEHHVSAHAWFERSGRKGWATNSLTQLGLLRLLTNPAVTQGAVGAARAIEALRQITSHESHEFWPLNRQLPDTLRELGLRIQGHRQWADAVLLAQAVDRSGVLVTFDSGMKDLAGRGLKDHVLLLKNA